MMTGFCQSKHPESTYRVEAAAFLDFTSEGRQALPPHSVDHRTVLRLAQEEGSQIPPLDGEWAGHTVEEHAEWRLLLRPSSANIICPGNTGETYPFIIQVTRVDIPEKGFPGSSSK